MCIHRNSHLTEDEKKYIYYVFKADKILHQILTIKIVSKTAKMKRWSVREKNVHNLIRRLLRRYKRKPPKSKKTRSFALDTGLYSYKDKINKRKRLNN